jgi:hypothetical protein
MQRFPTTAILAFLIGLFVLTGASHAQMPGLSIGASGETEASASADPSLDDLIGILENDDTRAKLIESLKAAAYKAPEAAEAAEAGTDAAPRTLPGEIAQWTRSMAGGLLDTWDQVAASLVSASQMLSGASRIDLPMLISAILPVGLVALVAFGVLFASRVIKYPIFRRLADAAERTGPINKLLLLVISSIVDALSVVVGWAAGYLAAVIFFGGEPGINQALFLNAFLLIEMVKVGLASFVSPSYPQLRLTPFSNRQASYWYFWISRLISILGYTFMFVAPIVQQSSSIAAAEAVRFIVVVLCLLLTIGLILKNRGVVRERLKRAKHQGDRSVSAWVYAFVGQIWWVLAIGFALALFIVWVRSPESGLAFMTTATLKSIAAMAVGGLIVSILSRVIARGIPIPQNLKDRLPLL